MGIQERRAREREARRSAVLGAARSLVRENGFNGTTTKQIAERSELSEATLFWYFQSKDEIFLSLLFEAIEFTAKGLRVIEADGLAPRALLRRLWDFFIEVRTEHPEYFHVFSYVAHPRSSASVTEEVTAKIARLSGDNFRLLAEILDRGLGTAHSRLVADVLWGSFFGLMILRDSRQNLGAPPHPSESDLDEAFEILFSGIMPHLHEEPTE